jgi:hypothetical protein
MFIYKAEHELPDSKEEEMLLVLLDFTICHELVFQADERSLAANQRIVSTLHSRSYFVIQRMETGDSVVSTYLSNNQSIQLTQSPFTTPAHSHQLLPCRH